MDTATGAADPIDSMIERIKQLLEQSERNAKLETQRSKDYKAGLDAVVKAKGELEKAYDDYRNKWGDLEEQRKELWRYRDQRYEASRRAVGEQTAAELNERFSRYNADLRTAEEALYRDRIELWKTQSALANAERERNTAGEDFAALKDRVKAIGERYKRLEELKTKLDNACDEAKHALRYVLILEFDLVLRNVARDPGESCIYWTPGDADDRPPLYSPATYKGKLVAAWTRVDDKQEALREAQEADAELKDKIARAKAKLEEDRLNRVDRVAPQEVADGGDGDGAPGGDGDGDGGGNGGGDGDGDGNGNGEGNGGDGGGGDGGQGYETATVTRPR